jgi:nucleoside 2-deoxyribosyltransferase
MLKPKIYLAHAKEYPNFLEQLYDPFIANLSDYVEIILPHKKTNEPYDSRILIFGKKTDFVVAEISYPATGLGIEIGWANANNIPVIGIFKSNMKISSSAKTICNKCFKYTDLDANFFKKLLKYLSS